MEEAARLGLEALALTDHDGFYGVVRFAEAARALGVPTVFGAELSLGLTRPQTARPTRRAPTSSCWPATPRATRAGLHHQRRPAGRSEKGKPIYDGIDWAAVHRRPLARAHRLPQGRGADRRWWSTGRRPPPASSTRWSTPSGGTTWSSSCATTATRSTRSATTRWPRWPCAAGVEVVATTNAHYATPAGRRLATAVAAVRARRSLDELDGWLPACAGAHLRSGEEQARRFARWPGAVARAAELGRACAFDLQLVAPQLPPFPCPDGLDEMAYLRRLTEEGAERRYGPRGAERIPGAYAQIDHELDLIEQLGFPGYFLVVWDIVEFCRREGIYCQGRGSAANSAVCFALGITNADAVALGLLFERFLSPERDGPPDIDIDIESGRREEVIQHVYEQHGRRHAAQVANVITYRAKSSVRDMAKALGYAPGQQDAWSKQVDAWGGVAVTADAAAGRRRHPARRARAGRRDRARPPPPRHPLRAAW